jgi:uncharacterized protein (DUF1499 family)
MAQKAPKKSLKHAQTKEKCINKFQRSLSNVPNQKTIAKNNSYKSLKCAQKNLKIDKIKSKKSFKCAQRKRKVAKTRKSQRNPSTMLEEKENWQKKKFKEIYQVCQNKIKKVKER